MKWGPRYHILSLGVYCKDIHDKAPTFMSLLGKAMLRMDIGASNMWGAHAREASIPKSLFTRLLSGILCSTFLVSASYHSTIPKSIFFLRGH